MLTALSTPDDDKNNVNESLTNTTVTDYMVTYAAKALEDNLRVPTPRKFVENKEFAAFARRIIRAHARRVASGDVEALVDLVALSEAIDQAIIDAVTGLREFGYSWAEIARPLGMSKQAAQQRWGGDKR